MAVKVSKENNILKLDNGTKTIYLNASWCSIKMHLDCVEIVNEGKADGQGFKIAFTDFQDGSGTPISTEETIVTYLSDKVG